MTAKKAFDLSLLMGIITDLRHLEHVENRSRDIRNSLDLPVCGITLSELIVTFLPLSTAYEKIDVA